MVFLGVRRLAGIPADSVATPERVEKVVSQPSGRLAVPSERRAGRAQSAALTPLLPTVKVLGGQYDVARNQTGSQTENKTGSTMPEYLPPDSYVEETPVQPNAIVGVPTSITAFVGPTRSGPIHGPPPLLTSLSDFERTYGDGTPLTFGDAGATTNFLWHAARAFFEEGGRRLYVARAFKASTGGGATDGDRPGAAEYAGASEPGLATASALQALEAIDEISIVAAPGSTFALGGAYATEATAITALLVAHAERMRYRIAVLDSGDDQSIAQVRAHRATVDSTHAALYYPWVRIHDPVTNTELHLPPSGFVAGIYARNDIQRGVWKAPANEVVRLATGFERTVTKAQQDVLNPEGINCFRSFAGRGHRLWGARTVSSDPEWKYVDVRRYFAYLENSIDRGTRWAVFEPNGEPLWATVRRAIEDFLFNEWKSGALLGAKREEAYFVKCDRTTMTQDDIDNGRLVCLVGVAPVKPAEFVIFRIGQWTADHEP